MPVTPLCLNRDTALCCPIVCDANPALSQHWQLYLQWERSHPPLAWPLALWLHIGLETGLRFLDCDWPASIWFNLGVWLKVAVPGCSPIVRLRLGNPQRIFSNCQYKQVRLVMRSFSKRCFNHLVWHKMLLSYNLNIFEMKLYYNYIYYHSQAYYFFVSIIKSLYLVRCSTFILA